MPQKPFEHGLECSQSCSLVFIAGLAAGRVSKRLGKDRAGTVGAWGSWGVAAGERGWSQQVRIGLALCTAGGGQHHVKLSAEGRP